MQEVAPIDEDGKEWATAPMRGKKTVDPSDKAFVSVIKIEPATGGAIRCVDGSPAFREHDLQPCRDAILMSAI